MVLSWLARSRRSASVDDLVARRRYVKAVEVLRAEFEGRQPTAAERLRLADLLVLARRGSEAVPILLGVADEQARFGFTEKALEALRRASEVEPGRPDVGRRIASLKNAAAAPPDAGPAAGAETSSWGSALDEAFPGTPSSGTNSNEVGAKTGGMLPEAAAPTPPPARKTREATAAAARLASVAGEQSSEDAYLPASELEPEPLLEGADPEAAEPELHLTEEGPEEDPPELHLTEEGPEEDPPELHVTEEELEDDGVPLLTEAVRETDEPRPLLTEEELETHMPAPLRVETKPGRTRRREPKRGRVRAADELHEFLLALGGMTESGQGGLGATLFADFPREALQEVRRGLTPHLFAPGDVVVAEGDPGDSLFLIGSGSVRVLIMGGHGQPFDIRRLDAGDFFGEVAVLTGRPRTATVIAATPCQAVEIDRGALEKLLRLRPAAQALMVQVAKGRARCPEEEAVRSLPPEAADPERAAAALQAHFGRSDWSPRVRTYLSRLMLDAGRQDDALAILASVAQDLARHGRAQKAIALLKKVEQVRRHGVQEIELAPLRPGRRRSGRHAPAAETAVPPNASRAATEAAFREWVGLLIRATDDLAARSAPSPAVKEVAERRGDGQRHQLPG